MVGGPYHFAAATAQSSRSLADQHKRSPHGGMGILKPPLRHLSLRWLGVKPATLKLGGAFPVLWPVTGNQFNHRTAQRLSAPDRGIGFEGLEDTCSELHCSVRVHGPVGHEER